MVIPTIVEAVRVDTCTVHSAGQTLKLRVLYIWTPDTEAVKAKHGLPPLSCTSYVTSSMGKWLSPSVERRWKWQHSSSSSCENEAITVRRVLRSTVSPERHRVWPPLLGRNVSEGLGEPGSRCFNYSLLIDIWWRKEGRGVFAFRSHWFWIAQWVSQEDCQGNPAKMHRTTKQRKISIVRETSRVSKWQGP